MIREEEVLLISIVIPVFNREKMLSDTLQSIADQIYKPIELILVDNGSSDGSLEVCRTFKDKCNNLFFDIKILQENKAGANAARNTGLSVATGDYVLFFDSDDIMYDDCIANIVGELIVTNLPEAIAVVSNHCEIDGRLVLKPKRISNDPADQLFDTVIPTHCICIKRSVFEKIGDWDEDLMRWQDLEFGFRALLFVDHLVWFTDKPLYEVKSHPDSISGKSYYADHEKMFKALLKIKGNIEKQKAGKHKDRLLRALSYKICTIAAQLLRERRIKTAWGYFLKSIKNLPDSRRVPTFFLLCFQFLYEGFGGRGLWRISRKLL